MRMKAHTVPKRITPKQFKYFLLMKRVSCRRDGKGHRRPRCLPELRRRAVPWGTPQHERKGEGTPDPEADGNHAFIFYRANATRELSAVLGIFSNLPRTATGEFPNLSTEGEAGVLLTRAEGMTIVSPDGNNNGAGNLPVTIAVYLVISNGLQKTE